MTSSISQVASPPRPWQAHLSPSTSLQRHSPAYEEENCLPLIPEAGTPNEPILIPSDVDSDSDDGDDDRYFDDSRSDATLPSIGSLSVQSRATSATHAKSPCRVFYDVDELIYIDLTKAGATKSNTDISMAKGSPRSPLHISASPLSSELAPQLRNLSPPPLSQASHLGDNMSGSGPLAGDDTEQGIATVGLAKRTPATNDSTPVRTPTPLPLSVLHSSTPERVTQSPTPSALDVDDASCSSAPLAQNSIPGTPLSSRGQSPETPQAPDLKTIGRRSKDAESSILPEISFRPLSTTPVTPSCPLGPTTRRRARQALRRLVQDDDDGDTDSSSQGRGFHPGQRSQLRDEGYYPSPMEAEPMGLDDPESEGEDECPRKRRRITQSSVNLLRNSEISVERPRRGGQSLRSTSARSTDKGGNAGESGILSPASSQAMLDETEARPVGARFEEWPLQNAVLKRITDDGIATFQLQFDWNPCTKPGHASGATWGQADSPTNRTTGKAKRASSRRTPFTSAEDGLLIKLKEDEMLAWSEIHRQYSETYPGRSVGSLQVRYCTKLKDRERS
ncbi:hypothetical protein QQX98_013270 [Neonectria punicea]|uniref:Myb-like domain-containing protein n=1 Tax=Neonectria punicea TaxID=979145 RepID=A0ABR1GGF5_9HYPO